MTRRELRQENERLRLANVALMSDVRRLNAERDALADHVACLIREKQVGRFEDVLQRALGET